MAVLSAPAADDQGPLAMPTGIGTTLPFTGTVLPAPPDLGAIPPATTGTGFVA